MKIPIAVFRGIQERIWAEADQKGWQTLADHQKSTMYENWIRDPLVGGKISQYMSAGNVRVHIKDTIMKPYGRERTKEFAPILKMLDLPESSKSIEDYVKPHGRRLEDGKVICWCLARHWENVLIAVYERAYLVQRAVPFCAILFFPAAEFR